MNITMYDVLYNGFMSVEKFLHYIHHSSFTLRMHATIFQNCRAIKIVVIFICQTKQKVSQFATWTGITTTYSSHDIVRRSEDYNTFKGGEPFSYKLHFGAICKL
jgi:hypothetical protein